MIKDENCCHSENPIENDMLVNASIVQHRHGLTDLRSVKKKK